MWDHVRTLRAATNEAKVRGYLPGRYSFNVEGGRRAACAGDGTINIEMHFLPDVYAPCEICKGQRYNRDSLDITFKGKNVAEILEDIRKLLTVLSRLVDQGNTVLVIEHDLDVIKTADWIIDHGRRRAAPAAARSWPRARARTCCCGHRQPHRPVHGADTGVDRG
jgi:excinuclease UvrABC ATPase subunit